jgi:CheY-like chemotaxis protein
MFAPFLFCSAHPCSTPLHGITGFTDLLLTTDLTAEQREFAQSIRESGRLLLTIISDVLDFSRMEAGKVELESIPFSPLAVGTHVTTMMAQIARSKGVTLECEFSPELPKVSGDPERLKQVLFNLCSNAIKFTPAGGSVRVRGTASTTDVGLLRLDFSVRDTGIGMTPEAAARVRTFEPFTQADTSTTRRFGGTGLGLSICKRLVALMGGDLALTTHLGRGSTFSFHVLLPACTPGVLADCSASSDEAPALPLLTTRRRRNSSESPLVIPHADAAAAAAAADTPVLAVSVTSPANTGVPLDGLSPQPTPTPASALAGGVPFSQPLSPGPAAFVVSRTQARTSTVSSAAAAPPPRPSISHRILCAEDNVVNQRILERFLRRIGFSEFTVVDNGQAAVAAVESGGYAICLMDCQMPVMDGYDATQRIRALPDPACSRIPIIAVTASTLQTDVERCRASGMDDHLPKPYTMRSLSAALATWLPPSQAADAVSDHDTAFAELRADSTGSATAVVTPHSAGSYDLSTRSAPTPCSPDSTAANALPVGHLPLLSLMSHSGSMQPSHSPPLSGRLLTPVTADGGQAQIASPSCAYLTSAGAAFKIPDAAATPPGPPTTQPGVVGEDTLPRGRAASALHSTAKPDHVTSSDADPPHSRAATSLWRGWCCSTSVAVAAYDAPCRTGGPVQVAAAASTSPRPPHRRRSPPRRPILAVPSRAQSKPLNVCLRSIWVTVSTIR